MNPTPGDLFISPLLTTVSVAYMQRAEDFVTTRIFPSIPVDLPGGQFIKYSKADWYRIEAQLRAPATESAGSGWHTTTDNFFANVYAFHKDIDDQTRASAMPNIFNLDREGTEFVTLNLAMLREKMWSDKFFKTGVWGQVDQTGVAASPGANQFLQWNNASSDPIGYILSLADYMKKTTGNRPNKIVMGLDVFRALSSHPLLIDTQAAKTYLTRQQVAALLEVDEIIIPEAVYNTTPEGTAEALANYSYMFSKSALLIYVPRNPSRLTPAAGYTFTWTGYTGGNNDYGTRIKKFRIEEKEVDRIEGSMAFDMKVVASDLGQFLSNAVA